MELTLLDTPGHVDFSAEMERVLQVLDYAVLLISGADGVQGHTQTLWSLLQQYEIPTFLFINKMDQPGANKEALMAELKSRLSEGCIDFSHAQYMENGKSAHDKIEQGEYVGRSDSLIPDTGLWNSGMRSLLPVRRRHWKRIWKPEVFEETDSGYDHRPAGISLLFWFCIENAGD